MRLIIAAFHIGSRASLAVYNERIISYAIFLPRGQSAAASPAG